MDVLNFHTFPTKTRIYPWIYSSFQIRYFTHKRGYSLSSNMACLIPRKPTGSDSSVTGMLAIVSVGIIPAHSAWLRGKLPSGWRWG